MSQPTDVTTTDFEPAPSVDEALVALTQPHTPGSSHRRLGWRRERGASSAPVLPADAVPASGGSLPAIEGGPKAVDEPAPAIGAAAGVTAAPAPTLDDAVAIEALGPYIARLMVDARQAAADYRRQTEREAAERVAEICAAAIADGEAIRARAVQEAEAILDAARIQAQSLAARVAAMAIELRAGADVLAQPAGPAAAVAPVTASVAVAAVEVEPEPAAEAITAESAAAPSEPIAASGDVESDPER